MGKPATRKTTRAKAAALQKTPAPPATALVPLERIERCILLIRGHRVMLTGDLAHLYAVKPKALVQAVKRNAARFPADFMFQLTPAEHHNLRSQFVTSSWGGLRRALPYAFTGRASR